MLSLDRALAIGQYFKKRRESRSASWSPLREDVLKVKTPDNTDELATIGAPIMSSFPPPGTRRSREGPYLKPCA